MAAVRGVASLLDRFVYIEEGNEDGPLHKGREQLLLGDGRQLVICIWGSREDCFGSLDFI